jgi:S-adenosylmethionine hydrolase
MQIALMTDFGTRDPYVAAMKGVLASRTDVGVVDLTHDIAPFDVLEGAWFLRNVVRYWPEGTIFVCVVDPGVGTSRRIVAVEHQGRVFLAPDNGLLTFIEFLLPCAASPRRGEGVRRTDEGSLSPQTMAYAVDNTALYLPNGSNTFHGRDRFAPVAAALANGMPIAEVGPRVENIVTLDYQPPSYGDHVVRGTIVAIDRFGNVITDLEAARIPFARFAMDIGNHVIDRVERNYGDAAPGAFLITGSAGCIEISVANGSAAEELGVKRLQPVELRPL